LISGHVGKKDDQSGYRPAKEEVEMGKEIRNADLVC